MVQGDIIKRIWSKNSQSSDHNELLDIWDTGSHIYERWPNGTEFYWRVISREETQTGFIETLEKQSPWQTPGHVLRREQIPLQQVSASQFQLGAWSVEQVIEKSCNTSVNKKQKEGIVAYHKGNRHSHTRVHVNVKEKI
jgi:hypothetical protein